MTNLQFGILFGFVFISVAVYATAASFERVARTDCSQYAMAMALRTFKDSMVETDEVPPEKRLLAEDSVAAKANYDFFFDFCLYHFEEV